MVELCVLLTVTLLHIWKPSTVGMLTLIMCTDQWSSVGLPVSMVLPVLSHISYYLARLPASYIYHTLFIVMAGHWPFVLQLASHLVLKFCVDLM